MCGCKYYQTFSHNDCALRRETEVPQVKQICAGNDHDGVRALRVTYADLGRWYVTLVVCGIQWDRKWGVGFKSIEIDIDVDICKRERKQEEYDRRHVCLYYGDGCRAETTPIVGASDCKKVKRRVTVCNRGFEIIAMPPNARAKRSFS